MTPTELALAIHKLRIEDYQFAYCVGVTDRTVRRWLDGTRQISTPVERLVEIVLKYRNARKHFLLLAPYAPPPDWEWTKT